MTGHRDIFRTLNHVLRGSHPYPAHPEVAAQRAGRTRRQSRNLPETNRQSRGERSSFGVKARNGQSCVGRCAACSSGNPVKPSCGGPDHRTCSQRRASGFRRRCLRMGWQVRGAGRLKGVHHTGTSKRGASRFDNELPDFRGNAAFWASTRNYFRKGVLSGHGAAVPETVEGCRRNSGIFARTLARGHRRGVALESFTHSSRPGSYRGPAGGSP